MLKKVYTEFKFQYMSKCEARKLMENSNLIDKKGILLKFFFVLCVYKNE